jgi:nitroreductase
VDVFDAMGSAVTMRWLRPDPVPDDLIERLIWAGTRAANPDNAQLWDFVVVQSLDQRTRLCEAMCPDAVAIESMRTAVKTIRDPAKKRIYESAVHLLENLQVAPVLIFICGSSLVPGDANEDRYLLSAIYGAAQNMLVAARALDLGVATTATHHRNVRSVRRILGIPDHKMIGVTMPVGWPARSYSELKRKPVSEVIHRDKW